MTIIRLMRLASKLEWVRIYMQGGDAVKARHKLEESQRELDLIIKRAGEGQ